MSRVQGRNGVERTRVAQQSKAVLRVLEDRAEIVVVRDGLADQEGLAVREAA
jgi:hypothetical protein